MSYILQLLVNKFTILSIEEHKENSIPTDIPEYLLNNYWSSATSYHSKWKKRLSLYSTFNALNAHGTSLYLLISIGTTNISKFSVQALVNSRATEIFINQNFVDKYYLNIQKLIKSVPIYNINGISNKNSQILEVVDIIFYYQLYLEYVLLMVFSLGKQDLILGFIQLKEHNSRMNQQKGEVIMM